MFLIKFRAVWYPAHKFYIGIPTHVYCTKRLVNVNVCSLHTRTSGEIKYLRVVQRTYYTPTGLPYRRPGGDVPISLKYYARSAVFFFFIFRTELNAISCEKTLTCFYNAPRILVSCTCGVYVTRGCHGYYIIYCTENMYLR